jgi:LysM repeat protein
MRDPKSDESAPRPVTSLTSDGSMIKTLIKLSETSNLDVSSELYNEALDLANMSDLSGARQRLQVLLGLYPSDGDAHLLLARVHSASSQWRLAMIEIQAAEASGTVVPEKLKASVERNVQADSSWHEDHSAKEDRENGELKKLRSELRRLRGENTLLSSKARDTEKESARWAWVAAGTSIVASLFIVGRLLIGGADAAPTTVPTAPAAAVGGSEASVVAAPEAPAAAAAAKPAGSLGSIRNEDLAKVANDALAAAGVADGLKVVVRGTSATITGSAKNNKQLQTALRAVQGTAGVDKVSADTVMNLAMRDGATHVVASGDTLSKIAVEYYGSAALHDKILAANPELGPKGNLHVGGSIRIPPVDQP